MIPTLTLKEESAARDMQISHFKVVDCGSYQVKRPLWFFEALALVRKDTLIAFLQ